MGLTWKAEWLDPNAGRILAGLDARGGHGRLRRPPGSGAALLIWLLSDRIRRSAVWITDGPRTLDRLVSDVHALRPDDRFAPIVWPARDLRPGARGQTATDESLEGERLEALRRLRTSRGQTVVLTCVQALMQPTVSPSTLDRYTRRVRAGDAISPDDLALELTAAGYRFEPEVTHRGEAARRGGIVDVWPPHLPEPVRMEFFGNTVESLRGFDPLAQRSVGRLSDVDLVPAGEAADGGSGWAWEYLPRGAAWCWLDPGRVAEHAELFERAVAAADETEVHADLAQVNAAERAHARFRLDLSEEDEPADAELDWHPLGIRIPHLVEERGFEPEAVERMRVAFVRDLVARAVEGKPVWIFFRSRGASDRFQESYGNGGFPPGLTLATGGLAEGWQVGAGVLTIVSESDLYGAARQTPAPRRREQRPREQGARIAAWTDMQPGELVVHIEHGVGRYLGLYEIEVAGVQQEVLAVEYAEKARLYVPVDQAHLLSRYIGVGRGRPALHRLGGVRWKREKQAAERAVRDLAASMLKTQAMRETLRGRAFGPDTVWQREFEEAFPFEETPDQAAAAAAVKADMESPRPMDRLICGDVGYGKTEVAMRAAFKAVMEGCQAAVLVPTTVLAQQHGETFRRRMGAFPVTIETLSRFRTRREQQAILQGLREGSVDVVIGTHRLVQRDIAFKNLGLVIIDEEQRFGVEHKEALKEVRHMVDVLTLTATPIPRTLYLGLVGARDLSVVQTAPRERLPIETVVTPWKESVVREAILREINREGQVYYLYNRVQDIHAMHRRLRALAPEARIRVAHGQMPARALEEIMQAFVEGVFDVLLCTTIIESGLDIPNVNTILIDRADRFGVADLYQLRGRVGRYRRQAHAYLLLPRHGRLFDTARKRIQALRRHGGLGDGFRLALQDLEIRGAGNLLGSEQSGHIAAVGFDLYCQLLDRTVRQLRGDRPRPVIEVRLRLDFIDPSVSAAGAGAATVPPEYMEDENHRLAFYRKLATAVNGAELRALRREIRDRFGPVPPEVDRLLRVTRIRILAHRRGLDSLETRGDVLLLRRAGQWVDPAGRPPRLQAESPDERMAEIAGILVRLHARSLTRPV